MTSTAVGSPSVRSATAAATRSTRSAVGSRTLPSSLPWSKWRAIQPSTQSVAPSTASSTAAPRRAGFGSHNIQRNTGTHSNRAAEMRFGIVRTFDRREPHRAQAYGLGNRACATSRRRHPRPGGRNRTGSRGRALDRVRDPRPVPVAPDDVELVAPAPAGRRSSAGSKRSSTATRPVAGSIVNRGALIARCGSSPSTSMRTMSCVWVCAWP